MNNPHKSEVKIIMHDNLMTIHFSKILTKKTLENIYTDVRFSCADLQPEFTVVADFSDTKFLYLNGLNVFRKIFNFILSEYAGEIIRVIQDDRVICKQLLNMSLKFSGHVPCYAKSVDDAMEIANKEKKRNGIRFNLLNHPVSYCVGDQKINGHIVNISTSGIAILSYNQNPQVDSLLDVKFDLENNVKEMKNFSLKARVVRTESYVFAACFSDLDETTKSDLWCCIVSSGK